MEERLLTAHGEIQTKPIPVNASLNTVFNYVANYFPKLTILINFGKALNY